MQATGRKDNSDNTRTSGLRNLDERRVASEGFRALVESVGEGSESSERSDSAVVAEGGLGVVSGTIVVVVFEKACGFFAIVVDPLDVDAAIMFGAEGIGAEVRTPTGIIPVRNRLCGYLAGLLTAEENHFFGVRA